ncbi:MAG: hypothetical protein AB1750_10875 [Chloroflexota bacterium]
MNGKFAFRLISALVLIAAVAGIAYLAYNAGVAQGSPITIPAPEGQAIPAPYFYPGYGMPFFHPFGLFGGCFGILITVFLLVVALKAFRMMAFGPRFGHPMGMHGFGHMHRGRDWGERGVPPMVEEWHKRMHGEQPSEDKKA